MEISFFVDKKSKIFCAGGITERQTRKVTETQKQCTDLEMHVQKSMLGIFFIKRFPDEKKDYFRL